MNYRHRFHAGNFADVMKHALLVRLVRGMQQKEKGFLFLDTHAGRGRYDLAKASTGDALERQPEWPGGIGKLWQTSLEPPSVLTEYLALVRDFDRRAGNLEPVPRFYPGSPWIGCLLARPVDRLALCEKHPAECAALRGEFGGVRRVSVHEVDGYGALRAMLPPPERRGLVLIDPPFEAQDEFAQISNALAAGMRRFPAGVYAIWYPLTTRARVADFLGGIAALQPRTALVIEVTIAPEDSLLKMKGCGIVVLNPPWLFEQDASSIVADLAIRLAQEPGGSSRVEWLVRERESSAG